MSWRVTKVLVGTHIQRALQRIAAAERHTRVHAALHLQLHASQARIARVRKHARAIGCVAQSDEARDAVLISGGRETHALSEILLGDQLVRLCLLGPQVGAGALIQRLVLNLVLSGRAEGRAVKRLERRSLPRAVNEADAWIERATEAL